MTNIPQLEGKCFFFFFFFLSKKIILIISGHILLLIIQRLGEGGFEPYLKASVRELGIHMVVLSVVYVEPLKKGLGSCSEVS